jgi:hypothetical protein
MYLPAIKFMNKLLLVVVVQAFLLNTVFSQSPSSLSNDPAVENAIRIYANAAGDQAPYYNGIEYRRYPNFIHSGQVFFIADSLMTGTITYEGVTYRNVRLQYDEVNDELITTDLQGDNLVQLYKEKIDGFTIGPHTFINLSQTYPHSGYYRVLYNGKTQIIAKETKSIQVKHGRLNEETERTVYANTDYYLKTVKGYEKFKRLNSFLPLFGNYRKQVAGFIRDKHLRSGTNREDLYYQAATFYDHLTR